MARDLLIILAALALAGCAAADLDSTDPDVDSMAEALGGPPDDGFSFARTTKELREGVPITQNAKWHVIYSIALKDLTPDERVAVRGEVQLTTCEASDLDGKTPCKRITPFDPQYKARIVVGSSAHDAEGPHLSDTKDVTCTPFRHHCAVALGESVAHDLSGDRFVNFVVAAVGDGNSKDVMIVDEGHGGLAVTRIGKDADASGSKQAGKDVSPGWMQLDKENDHSPKPHVTLQAVLHDAKPGEVIDVDAHIEAVTDGSGPKPAGCSGARDPLIRHQVFLSKGPNDPQGNHISSITAKNGANCHIGSKCGYVKSGALELPPTTPSTVYVSVVSWGGRSCAAPNDRWKLGAGSSMKVRRRD